MRILVIDFNAILKYLNEANIHTKIFETYFDICRLLDIKISREACFRLYTKHQDNYGKMKDYLSIMGSNPDKKKFDEEFFRRISQLYFYQEYKVLEEKKSILHEKFKDLASKNVVAITASHNLELIQYTLFQLDLGKYITTLKQSEYLNNYSKYIEEIIAENVSGDSILEEIIFVLTSEQNDIREYIEAQEQFKRINKRFINHKEIL